MTEIENRPWEGLPERVRDLLTVERVVGTPIEKDGVMVVPVAALRGGGGGGGGEGHGPDAQEGTGGGLGFGVNARPVGVYVIKDGDVKWRPAVDANRVVLVAGVAVFFVTRWLVARARSRS
jgi:uncharacterized spore protein YtfJ